MTKFEAMKLKLTTREGGFKDKFLLIKILIEHGESVGLKIAKELVDNLEKGKKVEYNVKNEELQNLRNELSKFNTEIEE